MASSAASSARRPYAGIFPIAPTPFTANGDLDLDGQRRVLDCMIDQGVDGICILANYSEQFLLSRRGARHAARISACRMSPGACRSSSRCSHFSTRIAAERGTRARPQAGASMLMLMPPYHGAGLRADETGHARAFRAASRRPARIPIMVQDAPLSGVALLGAVPGRAWRGRCRSCATSRSRCRAPPPSCAA